MEAPLPVSRWRSNAAIMMVGPLMKPRWSG